MIALLGGGLLACAAVLARALGLRRPAELVVGAWLLSSSVVLGLMHALSLAAAARRGAVVACTLAASAALLAGAAALEGPRGALGHARALVPSLVAALARRARRSGLAALALALVGAVFAHALVAAWLLPSQSWDGIWYHDTIVGWVVQTGSAAPMPLPDNLLQQVNGFPRAAELTCAWVALLDGGRALIELPNATALLPLASGTYLLCRRLARDRSVALALASVAVLAPGAILQLSSTYVDVYAAAAAVASLWLATRAPLSPRDVVLGGLAVALHVGAKSTAPLLAPFALGCLLVRALWDPRATGATAARSLAAVLATAAAVGSASLVYVKNALVHHNPLFPIDVRVARLGLSWPGVHAASEVDVNTTAWQTLGTIFLPTTPGRDFADIRGGGYGLAVAWVVVPLALAGLARAAGALRARDRLARSRALGALWPLALATPSLALSPALWSVRYNLHAIAVLASLAAYAAGASWGRRASRPAALVALGLSALAVVRFAPPLGAASLDQLGAALAKPQALRACEPTSEWTIEPEVARERERDLGPGTLAVFGPGISFPSLLYNERFDNRVAFLASRTDGQLAAELEALRPTWIAASEGEALYRLAEARPQVWGRVGLLSRGHPTIAFRRLAPWPDQ